MKLLIVYGNPKQGGFVHGCLDHVADRLEARGAEVDRLRLAEADIRDCVGCFTCLRTGACSIKDGMAGVIERMRAADGLIAGGSVRNGYFPALYKRFYERLSYIVGFGRELRGKQALAIGAVGMATGKKHLGRLLTFKEFQTHVVGYLFFRAGMPTRLTVERVAPRLDRAADRLWRAVETRAPLSPWARLSAAIDDLVIRKFMLQPNPGGLYDYVVAEWRRKGLL